MTVTQDRPDNSWNFYAACRDYSPDIWFPADSQPWRIVAAKRICCECPVKRDCTIAGLSEIHGIWGGLTPPERQRRRWELRSKLRLVRQ